MHNLKNDKHKAFTLGEVLVALGIIGVIAMIMIPNLKSAIPDKYETLHKKGSYAIEHAVSYIVNNEDYYDTVVVQDASGNNITHHGLRNTYKINIEGNDYGSDTAGSSDAQEKFCKLVASRFNIKGNVNCNASSFESPTFTSVDGIQWLIPKSSFDNPSKHEIIAFKTSTTTDKNPPNCLAYMEREVYNEIFGSDCGASCNKTGASVKSKVASAQNACKMPDIFVYIIKPNGTLVSEKALSDKIKIKK